jgi:dipeptidyl aminopeptidase/acylaminoacyl peptidase
MIEDITPPVLNVRSRVHEYGGGACLVDGDTAYLVHFDDQRIYRIGPDAAPRPLTLEFPSPGVRYADLALDRPRNRLLCVCEDHRRTGQEPRNYLVAIPLGRDPGSRPDPGQVLVEGDDFYSNPRLSPDGTRLAWLSWSHPHMPWDETRLWVAELGADGRPRNRRLIAGGHGESVFQPRWSPAGVLHFVSDRSGWWNLYRRDSDSSRPLCPMEAEFGLPQWVFGMSTYAFTDTGRLACTYTRNGLWHLARIDPVDGRLDEADTPYSDFSDLAGGPDRVILRAASPAHPPAIVTYRPADGRLETLHRSTTDLPDRAYLSMPRPIDFPSRDGKGAHALYYPPTNPDCRAPQGELPPLLVRSHGGPTAAASSALNLGYQYWTSRGFAVVDVNYGGSTGYGRAYRARLDGQWGVVDVDDCVDAATWLVERGLADPQRCAIRGSSAGGYTTLAALTFRDRFQAGASWYGIGDLEALLRDTHKFESRYLDHLIGPYPKALDRYRARSPIHAVQQLACPVIFLQGADDKVVPPNQAEAMVAALRRRGLPVAYLLFPGEGHGFRQAANLQRALEAELAFYAKVFGFVPADDLPPLPMESDDKPDPAPPVTEPT